MGTLYIIATPIGNLEDITLRALKTLWNVDVLLCEDTREAQKILHKYPEFKTQTAPRLLSFTEYNQEQRIGEVLTLLKAGKIVGLTTDRGTPLISDPGYMLIKRLLPYVKNNEVSIESIPGPSAAVAALTVSGLPPDTFYFAGFLPKKEVKFEQVIRNLPKTTVIAYESPERLIETLNRIRALLGDIPVAVCRELTKQHEEVFRGSVSEAEAHFKEGSIKGEITLVLSLKTV